MMKKMEVVDVKGIFHSEKFLPHLPEYIDQNKAKTVLDTCITTQANVGVDEVAFKVYKCFVQGLGMEIKFY